MTLRTPRRRISPQTKRRYRAIKGFFRRALGSSSQPDLRITSSIAVNVTDIKHKIKGLEQQLSEVSKQCLEITSIENTLRKDSQSQSLAPELRDEISNEETPSETQLNGVETELIHKEAEENDSLFKDDENYKIKTINKMNDFYNNVEMPKVKAIRPKDSDVNPNYRNHKTKSVYENIVSAYSTSSYHSLNQYRDMFHSNLSYCGDDNKNINRANVQFDQHKDKKQREHVKKAKLENYHHRHYLEREEKCTKNQKPKRISKELDQDFIADIIRRQYKPVKLFGRRESELSQFSAPVCRDREFYHSSGNHVQEEPQKCVHCCEGRHYTRNAHHSDHSDMRSVCDARLYSVKRNIRTKHRKKYVEPYNDCEMYDLVPVKEKSSPKSKRKFYEENMRPSAYYKEVPPSPRSQRPRLNLKAQYFEQSDDNTDFARKPRRRISPKKAMRLQEADDHEENYYQSQMQQIQNQKHFQNPMKCRNPVDLNRGMGTMSSLQYPEFDTEENTANVETPLNKTQETVSSADKTDKALCEIKDILQSFLQEIKKEASLHSGKSDVSSKRNETCNNPPTDPNARPSSGHSFHYNPVQFPIGPTPYNVPPFANNPCCYPMMPVCPINCMQTGYPIPSTSVTCNNCASLNPTSNEINHNENINNNDPPNEIFNCETDELIKEIYKFVSRSPKYSRKQSDPKGDGNTRRTNNTIDTKVLTSRSAGGSTRVCRRDKKVGTPKITGVSKSCEAIRSKTSSDTSSSDTNATYSDTILEKLSLDATQSATELSTELSDLDKIKRTKLAKIMKSLGLYKKSKRDSIQELSESESAIDVEVKTKKPPFRQNLTNYTMHGQEYYKSPPVSPRHRQKYQQSYRPPYNPDESYDMLYNHRMQHSINEGRLPQPPYHPGHPTAPPYSHSYEGYNQIPQVPLCLKEIEVKSIGCQSDRKMSLFRKMTQKVQQDEFRGQIPKNCSTQTAQNKPKLLSWMNAETKYLDSQADPYAYGYKTQKKLAEGDMKMRNAMLKKLFHKRNPFSPRNLILRTLLGKDKSSFGNPPAMYRPRMFL